MSRFLDRFRVSGRSPPNEARADVVGVNGRDAFNLTADGIVLLDASQAVTDANALALEFLQSTGAAVTGRSFWDIAPERVAELHQGATEQALAAASRFSFVDHEAFADNWIEYTFRRHAGGYVVNLRDVAVAQRQQRSLMQSERYNKVIFEANPTAMWVFDAVSLKIFSANQAAVNFYRMPRALFLTLDVAALFPNGDASALLDPLQARRANPGASPALSLCQQQKRDGQQTLVELAWSVIDWDGRRAVMVSIVDVSQRHLADSALRRVNAELEQALAARQVELKSARHELLAFTHAISSDLQDSLHAADGFSTRLAERYAAVLDEPGRHYVQRIQASIRQLGKLVDDLRTLAQISQLVVRPEAFDLVPDCQSLIAELRKRDAGRVVVIEMPASLRLVADHHALITALGCLLENAWKFSAKKSEAWISVAVTPGDGPGALVLQVSDNGAGFDPVYGGKLFTAFQRLHSSADFPGNGLGLAIVKRIAELHGGKVWAESGDQSGATFFMALPRALPGGAPFA